jgi:hypothetical protein
MFAANAQDTNEQHPLSGSYFGLPTMRKVADVMFVNSETVDYDYHLAPGSPAIDGAAGSEETQDYDKQVRRQAKDIGADEWCSAQHDNLFLGAGATHSISEAACNVLGASDFRILEGGNAQFQAGESVQFGNGFVVESSASLEVFLQVP